MSASINKNDLERTDRSPSVKILRRCHKRLETVLDYIYLIADPASIALLSKKEPVLDENAEDALKTHLLRDGDSVEYCELVTKVLVAEAASVGAMKRLSVRASESTMPEVSQSTDALSSKLRTSQVIDRAHARLFARNHKPSNVLTLGYRSVRTSDLFILERRLV